MINGLTPTVEIRGKDIAFEIIMMNRYNASLELKIFALITIIHYMIPPFVNKVYTGYYFVNEYD